MGVSIQGLLIQTLPAFSHRTFSRPTQATFCLTNRSSNILNINPQCTHIARRGTIYLYTYIYIYTYHNIYTYNIYLYSYIIIYRNHYISFSFMFISLIMLLRIPIPNPHPPAIELICSLKARSPAGLPIRSLSSHHTLSLAGWPTATLGLLQGVTSNILQHPLKKKKVPTKSNKG